MGREGSFNWTVTYRTRKLRPYFIPQTKVHSKWFKDINVRAKTTNLLEENTGINLGDLGLGSVLRYVTKIISNKGKNR